MVGSEPGLSLIQIKQGNCFRASVYMALSWGAAVAIGGSANFEQRCVVTEVAV